MMEKDEITMVCQVFFLTYFEGSKGEKVNNNNEKNIYQLLQHSLRHNSFNGSNRQKKNHKGD